MANPGAGVTAGVAALFPLWVLIVMRDACRIADTQWCRLIAHADGSFDLVGADGKIDSAAVHSNFQSSWGVLMTMEHSGGRYRQWVWRHHQPDDFRHLLVALARRARNI